MTLRSLGAVFAVGARSAYGDATESAMLLRTGLPALRPAPLASADGDAVTMGFDPTIDPYLVGEERAAKLAEAALADLARALGPALAAPKRTRAVLAFPEPRPGQRRAEASVVLATRMRAALAGPFGSPPVELSMEGAAGLGFVLPGALAALAAREVDALFVGGVQSDYDPDAIAALEAGGRLFSTTRPDAVIPGECAAFAFVARDDFGHPFGLSPLLRIYAVASERGEITPTSDHAALDATALADAIRRACEPLEDGLGVGFAISDHGVEHFRVKELYSALVRTHKRWCEPIAIDAPAQRMGQLGAAALTFGLSLASNMFRRGFAPTPFGLLLAGSDGGERAAILVGS